MPYFDGIRVPQCFKGSQVKAAAAGKKSRPPEGNPFPESYLQHALWERDHEPAVLPDDGTRSGEQRVDSADIGEN